MTFAELMTLEIGTRVSLELDDSGQPVTARVARHGHDRVELDLDSPLYGCSVVGFDEEDDVFTPELCQVTRCPN